MELLSQFRLQFRQFTTKWYFGAVERETEKERERERIRRSGREGERREERG